MRVKKKKNQDNKQKQHIHFLPRIYSAVKDARVCGIDVALEIGLVGVEAEAGAGCGYVLSGDAVGAVC